MQGGVLVSSTFSEANRAYGVDIINVETSGFCTNILCLAA